MQETLVWFLPWSGRSPGETKSYPLQYSGLENSMGCIVHGVAKSQTRLSEFHFYFFQWKWGVEIHLFFQELVSYVYLFLATLDLCCYTRGSLVAVSERLLSSCRVRASHCSGFICWGAWAVGTQASVVVDTSLVALQHVESSQIGLEPVPPALAGRFLTIGLPGKSIKNYLFNISTECRGLPCDSGSKESSCNAGDPGSMQGNSPGEGSGNPLQYSCLENSMDRGAWRATLHGVAKSQTRLGDQHLHFSECWALCWVLDMQWEAREVRSPLLGAPRLSKDSDEPIGDSSSDQQVKYSIVGARRRDSWPGPGVISARGKAWREQPRKNLKWELRSTPSNLARGMEARVEGFQLKDSWKGEHPKESWVPCWSSEPQEFRTVPISPCHR